ncbi:MAG: glycosyltransferase [Bdellovibrionales bacterium]|nr:glycosyltransferase [Bdellovibrionales bacterium]
MDRVLHDAAHIAIFLPSLRGGGAERAMLIFAEGLVKLGVKVDLIVVQAQGPLLEVVPSEVRLINLGKSRMLHALCALWRYLRVEKPQALYSTIVHTNIAALIAGRLSFTGVKVIVRESNSPLSEVKQGISRQLMHRLTPWVYPFAHRVIAVSEGVAEELRQLNRSFKRQIAVLPTPVITARFYELAEQDCPHPWLQNSPSNVILAAGRFVVQKDFKTLVAAFASVEQRFPEARLIILGEGPLRGQLESQIKALNLESKVALPGFVQNPLPFMKRARLFVLSSLHEGMPNVLVQALALGTPVVATDCKSGPRECLQDGAFGTLVKVGDVDGLAQAIDDSWNSVVEQSALDYCQRTYSAEAAAANYLQLIDVACAPA